MLMLMVRLFVLNAQLNFLESSKFIFLRTGISFYREWHQQAWRCSLAVAGDRRRVPLNSDFRVG